MGHIVRAWEVTMPSELQLVGIGAATIMVVALLALVASVKIASIQEEEAAMVIVAVSVVTLIGVVALLLSFM